MRKTILAATIALSAAIGAAGTTMIGAAGAQPAPPPAPGQAAPPPAMGYGGPPHPPHFMHHGWRGAFGGLIYRPEDRQLTAPEVQKIAEAFLLWNGNRTWKVAEVAERPDNLVGFAFATPDGSVIARFTMDRKTGRVSRIG
jgi:hypothetical protein